ncbi:unnamed protein product [Calypogeia fissa]
MAAVLNTLDSHLFELRNFKANEFLYRERSKMKPARGSPSKRSSPSPSSREGASGDSTHGGVSPSGGMSRYSTTTTETAMVESPQVKRAISSSVVPTGATPNAARTLPSGSVEDHGNDNNNRALALRSPLGAEEEAIPTPAFRSNDLGAVSTRRENQTDPITKYESKASGSPSLDEPTLKKLAKMVVKEMQDVKKTKVPIRLEDFTGEKSPYLAEDAIVWLKKLRLAARQNEWNHALALEVASVHLKGLAARWFASIEKHLNEELHLDRDRWSYFESQFEERFADFRSRLLQVEKIKELKLGHGHDVREYAEAIMSMNCRLEEPLDDEFLRWVFIQGLPPSELRDKLFKFEEKPHTLASAVKYARRFQLSQSVFNMKDHSTPISRVSPASTPARSVRSN